jgi:hypothetical protein
MPVLPARGEELEPASGPLHCHTYSKRYAITEAIELSGIRSDEDAVKRDKLFRRSDNLSKRGSNE